MVNFPSSLDSFSDPAATGKLNSPSHSQQHINANDALEKIEAKVGVNNSAVNTTHDYKIKALETITSEVAVGEKVLSNDAVQTVKYKRIITPSLSFTPDAGATQNLDLSLAHLFRITMPAGALTLTVSNELVDEYFSVEIINATSQTTLTWFSTIKWPDNVVPTLTGTNGKKDTFAFNVTSADNYEGYTCGQNI